MSKFRVAIRDQIGRAELRRYALRWALFGAAAVLIIAAALIFRP